MVGRACPQAAARHDYEGFYRQELAERQRFGYPPFGRLARLEVRDHDHERAEKSARELADTLGEWIRAEDRKETNLIGPVQLLTQEGQR